MTIFYMSKIITDYTQIAYLDANWVSEHILGLSDEEIAQNNYIRKQELKRQLRLKKLRRINGLVD